MSNESIPTLAEYEANLERTAVARRLCKNPNQFPTARQIEKEKSVMFHEATRGAKRAPFPTRIQAAAWLTSNGMTVPAKDKEPQYDTVHNGTITGNG